MTIFCVALVGKNNEPLYYFSKEDTAESLHLQMIVHSCLDVIEERRKKATQTSAAFDMYLGQLFPIEDYRTFGYYSNTHNKTIVVCDNLTCDPIIVKETINALNGAFVAAIENPFQPIGAPLIATTLNGKVGKIVQSHNEKTTSKNRRK